MKVLVCAFACLKDPDRRFGFGDGGEGGLGWNIILQLSRFFDVSVLTHITNKETIDQTINKNDGFKVSFYYIDLPGFLGFTKKWIQIYAYLWQIKAYFFAKELNKKNNFDVFHHLTYANDWMASFAGSLLPIPYVRGPSGGAHFVPKEFVKKYQARNRLSEKIRSIGQWIFRHDPFFVIGNNRAKALLVCNKEAFNALAEKWQKKAYFFPVNGISKEELSLFEESNSQIREKSDNTFIIISAGKMLKIKSFDLAIKVFEVFSKEVSNAIFIIVGDGPELKNLEKLSKGLKIGGKIIFEKWMPRKKLLQKIGSSDVFIFPSLRDGGGSVVVEAMAVGKPVICFDIAGPGFHIDEKCGIKVKLENPKQAVADMALALKKLYFDKDLRISLGKGAKEKAENQYDWDKLGDRLNEIYKKVL